MKTQILLLLSFLFFNLSIYGQEQEIKLVGFTFSPCDGDPFTDGYEPSIKNQWYDGDTLKIEFSTSANCCTTIIPTIEFKNDTLHLMFKEDEQWCSCRCCFQYIYKIVGLKGKKYKLYGQNQQFEQSTGAYNLPYSL